ncbi:hypothetical protein GCM10009755_22540 [Brevibacterium samyangense]|uniref:Uncharacterized protein n=1 Tax=Brevibacterium samyangense TaxID=366888 RepID=A0ABP5EXC0_9MICO
MTPSFLAISFANLGFPQQVLRFVRVTCFREETGGPHVPVAARRAPITLSLTTHPAGCHPEKHLSAPEGAAL